MGGGPSPEQKAAANSQAALNQQFGQAFGRQEAFSEEQQKKANPFYTRLMEQGDPRTAAMLDFASGIVARGNQPARQELEKYLGQNANALPSGFAQGARTDLASQNARNYDAMIPGILGQDLATKQQGAAGLLGQAQIANPQSYGSLATSGNQSIMQAPLARPGLSGLLGGLAGGLASAIPFVFLFTILMR